jgi:hypothetical protein
MASPSWARLALAVLTLVACALLASRAEAARRRVALVRPDPTLTHAVTVALSSWDIDVTAADVDSPGADLAAAGPRADALARSLGADAVAWVEPTGQGAILLVYDVDTKQLDSRVLDAPPPFDDARAAAVALSLKTVLRSSVVAPETERFGAKPPPPAPPPPDMLRVELLGGARFVPTKLVAPRGGVAVSFWPRFLGGRVGVGLEASTDLGANVSNAAFAGSFEDVGYAATLRARPVLSQRFVLEPSLRFALHDSEIEGTVHSTGAPIEVDYPDFALGAGLAGEVRFGFFGIGVYAVGDYLLRYQKYVARGLTVLSGYPWLAEGGLRASIGVF